MFFMLLYIYIYIYIMRQSDSMKYHGFFLLFFNFIAINEISFIAIIYLFDNV